MLRLSKSQFIRGVQCHKSLWLYKYMPKARTKPDEAQQAIFDAGTNAGILAQQLYPGGQELIYDPQKIEENKVKTQEMINAGVQTIYEATIQYDDVLVMVDILHKGLNGWELYEVKSGTQVKDVNFDDVAIQYYVVTGSGLPVSKATLVHINNKYERFGDLNTNELFTQADITEEVFAKQEYVRGELKKMQAIVAQGENSMPSINIGPQCLTPYECDFKDFCWKHIPANSVFDIAGMYKPKKFKLYSQGKINFVDIYGKEQIPRNQEIQLEAELLKKDFIDKDNIDNFLNGLEEPIGFLDFETVFEAVPFFDHQRPYQQVPFQYSLHIENNGNLVHHEYLGDPLVDSRKNIAEELIELTDECKTILAYNMTFEKMVLNDLAKLFPKYEQQLHDIVDKIVDLAVPFKNKAYYVKEMQGNYSLKNVLPAVVSGLGYDNLGIQDGGMAMRSYVMLRTCKDEGIIASTRKNLLEYCKLDTFGMVKILEKLKEVSA